MRYSFVLLTTIIIAFVTGCSDAKKEDQAATDPVMQTEDVDKPIDEKEKKKNVTDRDYTITPEEAYNNMFLDSLAMERYIERRNLADLKISRRIRSFYNARNYQYAWFSPDGLTEQARFFWNQYDYAVSRLNDTTIANSVFHKQAERYLNLETMKASAADSLIRETEFGFTEHFIRFINSTYEKGYVKRKEQERFIPTRKMDPLKMADSLLGKKHSDDKYYEQVNEMYGALKNQLGMYAEIVRNGGWPVIPAVKTLKKGDHAPAIPAIKKRLQLTKVLAGSDSSDLFTDSLFTAVQQYQRSLGYKPDGTISATLVKDMNVPALTRLKQILLNMDRMRWMPQNPSGHLVIVNIPEFMLHVYNGKDTVFNMVVVVGRVGNNTMMFNGDLSQIVFSPYWNVPPSIIEKEIKPAMARNPGYLASKNMEQVGSGIRQKPGPGNALGKVKFIFPNSFNMYFHDTPAKSLFGQDKRAFSHGCIRLSEPQKMAEWLLRDYSDWPVEKIVSAMNQTRETVVKLKQSVPVFIIYYTAWVDRDGQLNFRDDVYQHDQLLMAKMFKKQ